MELYISDHPLDCLTCSANNDCELQDQAAAVGLRDVRYGYEGANHLAAPTDASNPYFDFDATKCIVCSRCVRACDEVQGTLALTMEGRGFGSQISAGVKSDDFLSSECVSCGACVQACPTSALMEKAVTEIGKPERAVVTTCAYCGWAARSAPKCAGSNWCAWCRGRMARPIAGIPASRAASPGAMPSTRIAFSSRWCAKASTSPGAK
jgi:formate dehydrogenase major subunit